MGKLLNNKEQKYFDRISLEVLELAGTEDPILWKFIYGLAGSVSGTTDCLYEEPIIGQESKNYVPYPVLCYFETKDRSTDVDDSGSVGRTDGRITFVRKNLEDVKVPLDEHANHVGEGDIIQLWSKNKLRSWYFQIINVNRDGFEHDSDVFTTYVCDVARNDSFIPERQLGK